MRAQFRFRVRIIFGGVLFVALLLLVRLYGVQVVQGHTYAAAADQQFLSGGNTGLFDRGAIYFTRKDGTQIAAATLATGYLVAINPQTIEDPAAVYAAVSAVASTTLSRSAFLAAAGDRARVYVEVAHHLPDAAGKALAAEDLPGVQVLRERWRYYPGGSLAAHEVGIVSYGSGDTLSGQTGLESVYDSVLERSPDSLYSNFFAQLFSNVGSLLVDAKDAHEGDVVTTIEPSVEARLMHDLAAVNEKYSSRGSGGIIMDPSTGAIIAMASYPTYDENNLATVTPALLGDPLVEHVHEFGSIMKPLTMASALDAGAVTPQTTYDDTGCITVDHARICNWDYKARGVIPMIEIIKQSLNVGASWVATRLGQDKFRAYFTKLFGQKTGVDQPSESGALLGNLDTTQQVNFDNMSFGQGIAVTPVQMIRALGAIANGGVMVTPHLVSAIRLSSGVTRPLDWGAKTRVFSATAARETTSMMDALMDDTLMHGAAKIPTMSVAVKTGTAQLPSPSGGYYTDRFFHSFTGFFPSYNPRFIILLYTDDPQHVEYASETLDSTFLDLVHFLIDYYNVPPDRSATSTAS